MIPRSDNLGTKVIGYGSEVTPTFHSEVFDESSEQTGLKCGLCNTKVTFDEIKCLLCDITCHKFCMNVDPCKQNKICPVCKLQQNSLS